MSARRRGFVVLLVGVGAAVTSARTGTAVQRVDPPVTLLDQFVPAFQFREAHEIEIHASAERTYQALYEVTPDETAFYRTLTSIRRLGRSTDEGLLNPSAGKPLLETAITTLFRKLAERPNEELVVGGFAVAPARAASRTWTRDAFINLDEPHYAKTGVNFRIDVRGPVTCILHTETRVYATDPATRCAFAVYWRTIYPGSALIRRMWLRAIKARAEGGRRA